MDHNDIIIKMEDYKKRKYNILQEHIHNIFQEKIYHTIITKKQNNLI